MQKLGFTFPYYSTDGLLVILFWGPEFCQEIKSPQGLRNSISSQSLYKILFQVCSVMDFPGW